jgi:hypothetical protein
MCANRWSRCLDHRSSRRIERGAWQPSIRGNRISSKRQLAHQGEARELQCRIIPKSISSAQPRMRRSSLGAPRARSANMPATPTAAAAAAPLLDLLEGREADRRLSDRDAACRSRVRERHAHEAQGDGNQRRSDCRAHMGVPSDCNRPGRCPGLTIPTCRAWRAQAISCVEPATSAQTTGPEGLTLDAQ